MKIKLSNFAAAGFLFLLFGGGSVGFAQDNPVTGGYAEVSVRDKNVIKAAKFAVRQRAKTLKTTVDLVSIKNAKRQVAAGINYEICMLTTYRNKKSKKLVDQFVQVVVYRSLKNTFSLTSWIQENCTEQ